MEKFKIYSNPEKVYKSMISDIQKAKKLVYLETYIYDDDFIGDMFKRALKNCAKIGIKVKLLVDSFGSNVKKEYFDELVKCGAEVRFFREIMYTFRLIEKNNERNHRKLLIIDDDITYLGSCNITASCLSWRELVIKLKGPISGHFADSFLKSWKNYGAISDKIERVVHKGFEILNDVPSAIKRVTERKYLKLIRKAKSKIIIETPYFVPSLKIRSALYGAVKKGVRVMIVLPFISDVRIVDILRGRYLGKLYKNGIKIYYYKPAILHSKLLMIDDKFFLLGSSNLDYRSFIYQHEINLFGNDKKIVSELNKYFKETMKEATEFDYNQWNYRSSFLKIFELLLIKIRHYF
jgi:cardiolipin synthase